MSKTIKTAAKKTVAAKSSKTAKSAKTTSTKSSKSAKTTKKIKAEEKPAKKTAKSAKVAEAKKPVKKTTSAKTEKTTSAKSKKVDNKTTAKKTTSKPSVKTEKATKTAAAKKPAVSISADHNAIRINYKLMSEEPKEVRKHIKQINALVEENGCEIHEDIASEAGKKHHVIKFVVKSNSPKSLRRFEKAFDAMTKEAA